jgi:hypothetical protein
VSADATGATWSAARLAEALQTTEEQVVNLTLVGWLPPAAEVRNGRAFWTDDAAEEAADAYGKFLAYRVAEADSSAIAAAVIRQARVPQ